jgi:cellobiose epimerase
MASTGLTARSGNKHMTDRQELLTYRATFEQELEKDILAYWMTYAPEKAGDGFYGAVDLNNNPVIWANKSCVLNARILWAFSAAAARYPEHKAYASLAERAYLVLKEHFADLKYGGYFMELTPDNHIASAVKHTYAQAFVIYALSQYYQFNRSQAVLQQIQDLFNLIEQKAKDPLHPGYGEAFDRSWQPITENRMADDNEPRSMNTHLHILEAYAAYYRVSRNAQVAQRLRDLLLLFLDSIIRPSGHLGIFFDLNFNETGPSGTICSFGHDIEASWLLWEAAEILGDEDILVRMRPVSVKMLEAVDRDGLDKDGGLFLESVRSGSHVRTNKHWWLQAETLVGLMNGFQLTGRPELWEKVKLSWNFINRCVIDHQGGEWFTKVNRHGEPFLREPPDDPSPYYRNDWKIDPWKCPYHNGRACLEMIHRIDQILDQMN